MSTDLTNIEKLLAERINEAKAAVKPTSNLMKATRRGFEFQGGLTDAFSAIIVGCSFENTYYDRPFEADAPSDPLCFAIGLRADEMAPPEGHSQAQSESCSTCPHNEWGSKGRGKACRNGLRIALLPVADPDNVSINLEEIAILRLAPTSLQAFEKFRTNFYRWSSDLDLAQVVSEFKIDKSVDFPKVAEPGVVKAYDDPGHKKIEKILLQREAIEQSLLAVDYTLNPTPWEGSSRRSRLV